MTHSSDYVLASATDDAFAPAAAVALLSAATSTSERPACLILDCGLSSGTKSMLERSFATHDVPFYCRRVDVTKFSKLPLTHHFTSATYARMAAADLAADLAPRTLYLDADTLTITSIRELVRTELNGCAAAAVQDPTIRFVSLEGGVVGWARVGLPAATAHFNAGVLLIDNDAWRSGRLSETALEVLRAYPDEATFADQGALNRVLAGAWMPVDDRWNVAVPRSFAFQVSGRVVSRHRLVEMRDLGILHFVGNLKPWQEDYAPSAYRRMYVRAYRRFARLFPEPRYGSVIRWARIQR